MAIDPQPAAGSSANPAAGSALPPGARLGGGRYTLQDVIRPTLFGTLYRASDATTGHPVTVHILRSDLIAAPALVEQIARRVEQVRGFEHKNLARVIEFASEGNHVYLVGEPLDGHTLRQLLERKKRTGGGGFNAKGAQNIISHVCSGLAAVHPRLAHGALSLDNIVVNRAGRVKIADLELEPLVPAVAARGNMPPSTAPEVIAGRKANVQSDVYAIGAIVYEILVAQPPVRGCQRPSEAAPGLSPLVDQFVVTCMHPQPDRRPADIETVKSAAIRGLTAPSDQRAAASGETAATRPSLAQEIARPRASAQQPAQGQPAGAPSAAHSNAALNAALADTHERWLISKGKLDYGPFALAQVVEQINNNNILPGHVIIDNSTGERITVEDHPLLGEIVDAAKQRRDEQRRAQAEVVHAKQERRRGAALYFIVAGVIAALGVGAFFIVSALGKDDGDDGSGIESLEEGSLTAKITFPSKEERKRRNRRHARSGNKVDGTSGGWDDSLDLDMEGGGGSERLDDSQINPVIQKHGGRLGRCLSSTGSRYAAIDFIIKGTGKVSQVRVNGETGGPLANCVRKAMMSMNFPSFDGARTKATFDMSL